MAKVVVYTTHYCPYCTRAKRLLAAKGVAFEEIDVSDADDLREDLVRRTGRYTVPQIFINDASVGGYEELQGLEDSGELDGLLG
jgi:glutaredoxin 3